MRLVTRADLDGLACALLLDTYETVDEIVLVHPQEITDKTADVRAGDIVANLPYHPSCDLWFDHHLQTASNSQPPTDVRGRFRLAPSAAQVVWEHYGEEARWTTLIAETNKVDAAQLTEEDVLRPQGHVLLGYLLDPRTGLGDDEAFFHRCFDHLRAGGSVDDLLRAEDVAARVMRMFAMNEDCCWTLSHHSRLIGNVVFTDLRRVSSLPVGNRFLVYTLFPESNVSVRVQFSQRLDAVMVKVGHSIFNRTCQTSVGELMSEYGGGGHRGAGSAPLDVLHADMKIYAILDALQEH
ncbi:MAG: exopolyphosphatase [Acidobacteriota bacterium]